MRLIELEVRTSHNILPLKESDLPMDKASRMKRAAELGFTIPAYHGTSSKFNEFDLEKGVANSLTGFAPHFSGSKAEANGYAQERKGNGEVDTRVMHVLLRIKKPFERKLSRMISPEEYEEINGNPPDRDGPIRAYQALDGLMFAAFRKYPDGDMRKVWRDIYRRLMDLGYDAIIDSETAADFSYGNYAKIVILDPSNIRSIKACFDPAKSNSANLMA